MSSRTPKRDQVPAEEVVERLRNRESLEEITRSLRERDIIVSTTTVKKVAREHGFVFDAKAPLRAPALRKERAARKAKLPRPPHVPKKPLDWGPIPVREMVFLYLQGQNFWEVSLLLRQNGKHYTTRQIRQIMREIGIVLRPEGAERCRGNHERLKLLARDLEMPVDTLLEKMALISRQ